MNRSLQLGPGGRAAVHHRRQREDRLHGRPHVLTDIIKGLPIGDSSENAALADDASDNGEDTGAAFVADETEFNIFNTDLKLAALEQVVRQLATLPEKKALVYVTGGISKSSAASKTRRSWKRASMQR
jgi:hypothetical protein